MFKKFKDKLAEEMKQSPARLQASMQQLAQAVVSPALSNTSVQELSSSNDNFSLTEEGDETPKNSPARHGFQDVDLISPTSNSIGISRRSSISSVTSDSSSLFPIYESPANLYHLQSDMDQSASEIDENISPQLDKISKDQIYSAYRKVQAKYHKYRGRYTDLATHYKELERVKGKLESILVETQDKVLRRVGDLKEQCQLEQQAKAHLEEALRNDIEEKDHIINTLNTKIKLLQAGGSNFEATLSDTVNDNKANVKDNLIDLNTEQTISSNENALAVENAQLKEKLKKLENVVLKYKESLKRNKEKFTEVLTEKNTLESEFDSLKSSFATKEEELNNARTEIKDLTEQMIILKKREEESVISLAENKLSIHRELEDKEEQIKKLQLDLKNVTESKDHLSDVVDKYRVELEKLKSSYAAQNLEKKDVQDASKGKSENLKPVQQDTQQKLLNFDNVNLGVMHHEEDSNKGMIENSVKTQDKKVDDQEIEPQAESSLNKKLEELQKLNKEYQVDKDKLCMELSNFKLKCVELQSDKDAQKIIAQEKKKEAETTIDKLQATIQSLDKELENMRNALIDRDKVCENYNAKIQEYATMHEKNKEQLLTLDTEIKTLKEQVLLDDTEIINLNSELKNKSTELLRVYDELHSCTSVISDLENRLGANSSKINVLYEEKNNLTKNILNYKNCTQKLKEGNMHLRTNLVKHFADFNNEISILKDEFNTLVKTNSIKQTSEMQNVETKLKEFEELQQKYDQLETELADTLDLKSNLEADLKIYKEQLSEVSVKLEQQADIEAKNRQLIDKIDNLKTKLHDLQNLSKQMELLTLENKSLMEQLHNATATNSLLSNEVHDLKARLAEASNDRDKLEELKEKYVEATDAIALLKSQNSNCNKLEEEISDLQSKIKHINEDLFEKDKEISTLNDELRNKDSYVVNLKIEDENNSKLVEEYGEEIAKLTDSNKTLQQTIQAMFTHVKMLEATKQQQDVTIQKLNDEIIEVKSLNTQLTVQLETLEKETGILKSENCQILTLKNSNSTITSELEQLKLIQHEIDLENKNLKDKQNECLKHNQELNENNEKLKQKVTDYEEHNQELLTENARLDKEIESYKDRLSKDHENIDHFKNQITLLNAELESYTQRMNTQIDELISYKKIAEELKERLTKENDDLNHKVRELNLIVEGNKDLEEQNKELVRNLELLNKEVARLKAVEEEINNLKLEANYLNKVKVNFEEMHLQNDELINENLSLKHKVAALENVNSANKKLQSDVNNLESKVSILEQTQSKNSELKNELDTLKSVNADLLSQIKNENIEKERLITDIDELKHTVHEKLAGLIVLGSRNTELLNEIESLKNSTIEQEILTGAEAPENTIEYLNETIAKLQEEVKLLKGSNNALEEEVQNVNSKIIDDSLLKSSDKVEEITKKFEAQLDEALITSQAKELQMQIANNELKTQADNLREELRTNEEEQSMRLKQLVKEFQAQLQDKEEELHAALEKRFDRQQNYESSLIQQYKEQLKDFQVELTTKSEQIENLILENKNLMAQKAKDINQLMEKITFMKKGHTDEIKEIEKKWKSLVQQKSDKLEAKHEEEINELTKEWRNERKPDTQTNLVNQELESTSRVAMAAVQSNTGSFHTLQQTLTAQRRELTELRKLVKLKHDTLEDSTEIEYLRNILFEYMMGKETMVLARVIAAVVKFDQEQTTKILKKEEDKMTLLGSLGLT